MLYQCFDTKQYSEKSFEKSWENNCDSVLLTWSCRLWGNWRKDFNNSLFWVNFWWNFSDQLFSKTASGESLWRTFRLWDFTSALEVLAVFVQVNFDQLFGLHSNSRRVDKIKHLPFCNRNTELLSCLIYHHALAQLYHNNCSSH